MFLVEIKKAFKSESFTGLGVWKIYNIFKKQYKVGFPLYPKVHVQYTDKWFGLLETDSENLSCPKAHPLAETLFLLRL